MEHLCTSFSNAIINSHNDCIRELARKGDRENLIPENILIEAMIYKRPECVTTLLECGADIEFKNHVGHTALHASIGESRYIFTEILLQNGANPNVSDMSHMTPLHIASANGLSRHVSLLLRYGADPELENMHGLKPIQIATNQECKNLIHQHTFLDIKEPDHD